MILKLADGQEVYIEVAMIEPGTFDISPAVAGTGMISVPRRLLEQLVDPGTARYIEWDENRCAYCYAMRESISEPYRDTTLHTADCPVRILQERLRETSRA